MPRLGKRGRTGRVSGSRKRARRVSHVALPPPPPSAAPPPEFVLAGAAVQADAALLMHRDLAEVLDEDIRLLHIKGPGEDIFPATYLRKLTRVPKDKSRCVFSRYFKQDAHRDDVCKYACPHCENAGRLCLSSRKDKSPIMIKPLRPQVRG